MDDIGNLEVGAVYSLCRLCALKSLSPVFEIFSEEGILRELKKKIENCLHFTVTIASVSKKIYFKIINLILLR